VGGASSAGQLPRTVLLAPHNGGLAMARALRARGERPVVLACPAAAHVAATRGVESEVLPTVVAGRERWIERVSAQGEAIVIPGTDDSSDFLARERDTLPASIRTFEGSDGVHLALMSKPESHAIAERAGVRWPRSFDVTTVAELEQVAAATSYPCIAKPALSHRWRMVFGEERVLLAPSAEELVEHGLRALDRELDLVVSEYVPGPDSAVEEAILVRAADGSYPVEFGCHKLRQHPPGFGAASLCETAPIPETMAIAKQLLDAAGFVGVVGVETKRHAETGERFFLDANVRLPTQWGLGDAAGGDSSWRLCATLAGISLGEQPPIKPGVRLVYPQLELHAAIDGLRARDGDGPSLTERLRGWRGAGDLGIADPRDPGPALALVRGSVAMRVAGLRRRRVANTSDPS
jgi:predicted ATP-grasp superfamily ATP-dependent carboligase